MLDKTNMWDKRFLELTRHIAGWSKDPSTKCGAVIVGTNQQVLSTGYNGLPRGLEYSEKSFERPYKYYIFEHAERNAIYCASRHGVPLEGSTMYVTGPPCADCARAIVQVGIKIIVYPEKHNFLKRMKSKEWAESIRASREILRAGNVIVVEKP